MRVGTDATFDALAKRGAAHAVTLAHDRRKPTFESNAVVARGPACRGLGSARTVARVDACGIHGAISWDGLALGDVVVPACVGSAEALNGSVRIREITTRSASRGDEYPTPSERSPRVQVCVPPTRACSSTVLSTSRPAYLPSTLSTRSIVSTRLRSRARSRSWRDLTLRVRSRARAASRARGV